ncbi:MAG: hypothetical protein ACLFQV_10605 [Vulcanimicrobiota bacterium]
MEKKVKTYRNVDIKTIRMGAPGENHKHLRALVETEDEFLVFQEATIAALVRAYISVKNHPQKAAVLMAGEYAENLKPGFARWQLLERDEVDQGIIEMMSEIME